MGTHAHKVETQMAEQQPVVVAGKPVHSGVPPVAADRQPLVVAGPCVAAGGLAHPREQHVAERAVGRPVAAHTLVARTSLSSLLHSPARWGLEASVVEEYQPFVPSQ